jgi:protein-disulfide isomerase
MGVSFFRTTHNGATIVILYMNRKDCMKRTLTTTLAIILFAGMALAQQAAQKPKSNSSQPLPASPSSSSLPSEDTVNAFMHQMMGYDPNITWKIDSIRPTEATGLSEVTVVMSNGQGSQVSRFYVTSDGQHAVMGEIIPFGAHPFAITSEKLKQGMNGPSRGPANAPVTIVEFSDLQCPHCKAAQPILDKLLSEDTNVRLVYQNFPLNGHDWAQLAAGYADCIGRKSVDNFTKFVSAVFDAQSDITAANAPEKLTALAEQSGEKGTEIAACASTPDTTGRIESSQGLGLSVGVDSTPTIFINGRKFTGVTSIPYESLKQLVDFAATDNK